MKLTCPRCGNKGIVVDWSDCLSSRSRFLPRRCAVCGGEAKRPLLPFSWRELVVGLPIMFGVLPTVFSFGPLALKIGGLGTGWTVTMLLQGFWLPFYVWPKPFVIPPVIIPSEEDGSM